MTIVKQEAHTIKNDKWVVNFTLWSDETPSSLAITGADIGRPDVDIAVGSVLMTPAKRYIYGENGSFVELSW